MDSKLEIIVCMGSACFARGNAQNLEYIENYLKENKLEATVGISGSRCEGNCAQGPNIIVNGIEHCMVDEVKIDAILGQIKARV